MDKIVGKVFIFFLSLSVVCLNARVTMEVRTDNGAQNQVVVGQPFTLDVVIDEVYGSIQTPTIKGLNGFAVRQSGSYMSSINGKSSARYSYQVRIDKLGSFTLGPAIVTHQQQEYISNEVRVDVVKDVVTATNNNKSNQATEQKAFLRLMVDSESVFVGQKVSCILRFYFQDTSLSLHNVGMPELPAFDGKEVSKLEQGTAEVDGIEYHYAQWRWDMYPTKPGEFIIPAYNADYDIPLKDNHLFGGLFMFVSNRVDRKRVYSNAVTLKVLPLPHYNHPVHAVGVFERFSAEIKPGMAKEGEGMVLTMDIEGNGNLQAIAIPILQLPKSLKYYDSNNSIIIPRHSDELPKKRFEFIVQGMQAGDCEIPEQLFTYFDIERHAYVTLRTSPLAVSIKSGMNNAKKDMVRPVLPHEEAIEATVNNIIADINVVGQWYPVTERRPLPWWVFQLLFLIPCMYIIYPFMADKFIVITGNNARLKRRRVFKNAHKQIDQAIKNGEAQNLHSIFMQLIQQLNLSTEILMKTEDEVFERITHAAYAHTNNDNSHELCRMAKKWLERLEKTL